MDQILNLSKYYYLNPHAIAPFIMGIFILIQAIYVFDHNRKSNVNFAFLLLGISIFMWFFGDAMIYCSRDDLKIISFWSRHCVDLGVVFLPANIYFFMTCLLKSFQKNKPQVLLNYLISLILFLLVIKTDYFAHGIKKYWWGWYSQFGPASFLFVVFFSLVVFVTTRSFLSSLKSLPAGDEKNRIKYVFIGLSLAYIGAIDLVFLISKETLSTICRPYPSKPTTLRGLFVISFIFFMPKSTKICAPIP